MVLGQLPVSGVLLIWIIVEQEPTVLVVVPEGVDIFLASIISLFFLLLSERRPDIDRNTVSKGR